MAIVDDTLTPVIAPLLTKKDGAVRVGGTRVTLDTVIGAYQQGATPEEIALQYDVLQLADIYAVISYYLQHRPEVEEYLDKRNQEAEAIRQEIQNGTTPAAPF